MVLNVLPKHAYDDCRIKGSINVPLDHIEGFAEDIDREQTIVVYCASYMCVASRLAWQKLDAMEFKNIWAYEGGMAEWHQAGLPVEGACREDYLSKTFQKPEQEGNIRQISLDELKVLLQKQGAL